MLADNHSNVPMFDPYHKWLGIPPKDQPPNHYRLLGIDLFESDPEVIDAAANRQMAYLQQRATGEHGALSQELLNEVAAARLCLLDTEKKRIYDEGLRQSRAKSQPDRQAAIGSLLHEELESEVSDSSTTAPSPILSSVKPRRHSWSVEPWHIAVVIGVAFLIGLGGFAFLSSSGTGTIAGNSTTANSSPQETESNSDTEQHDDRSVTEEIGLSDTTESIVASSQSTEPKMEDATIKSGSVDAAEENEPKSVFVVTYSLTVSPPQAILTVLRGEADISGSGSTRWVTVPSDNIARLEATCDGYESDSKWLLPNADETRSFSLSLRRKEKHAQEGSHLAPLKTPIVLCGHKKPIRCLALSANGERIVSGSIDASVRLWDLRTGKQLWEDHSFSTTIWGLAFTPDDQRIWACGAIEAKCFDCGSHRVTRSMKISRIKGPRWPVVEFSPDTARLVVWASGVIEIYDLTVMKRVLHIGNTWASRGLVDRQGRILFGGTEDTLAVEQRLNSTGEVLRSFYGLRGKTTAIALSTDEQLIAAASGPVNTGQSPSGNQIIVWRYAGGVVQQISVKDGWQYALAFSPDGRYLASGGSGRESDLQGLDPGSDKSIRIWEIKTGREVRRFTGHSAVVGHLAFTPDGKYLVSGGEDSTIRVWPFRE